jgi:UTP--glucose-1-phosphate uridylyltransferase
MKIEAADLERLVDDGFDPEGWERVWGQYREGRWDGELVVDGSRLAPPADEHLSIPPEPGSGEHERYEQLGREAIDRGHVGAIVLNGGMATRFGGVVKGTVEVVDGRSFLDLKISQIRSAGKGVHVYLMNSPATHGATLDHLSHLATARALTRTFLQPVGLRVDDDGALVRGEDGQLSTAGMGHGDVLRAFHGGGLDHFRRKGGRVLMVSNVDNLGATLDPLLVGMHIYSARRASVVVARRRPEDRGGMPVLLDGRCVLLEGLRWPAGLDDSAYSTFNTNTFLLDADVFDDPPELDAYPVRKKVAGREVIQFERILGEVTHHMDTNYVVVPIAGDGSRFIPIKKREDLDSSRQQIVSVMRRWEVL